jgi:hypothetical protein
MIAFLKQNLSYLFLFATISFSLSLILAMSLWGLCYAILQFLACAILLYFLNKEKQKEKIVFATYRFLQSFISNLNLQKNVKASLEIASYHLDGYQVIKSYEECLELKDKSYRLYGFEKYFRSILEKEEENQAQLIDYYPLLEEIQDAFQRLEKKRERREKNCKLFLILYLLSLSFLALVFQSSSFLKEIILQKLYLHLSGILLSLSIPLYLFFLIRSLRNEII